MKVQAIYEKYNIMPQLQLHMLRVAGVASIICDNFEKQLDKNTIISVCLLHDLGNVLKFNFNSQIFPESWFTPKGKKYWKEAQKEFIYKYGNNEYLSTDKILKKLQVENEIRKIISEQGFNQAEAISKRKKFNTKITNYSDLRVSPFGIVSLEGRIDEASTRYSEKPYFKMGYEILLPFWLIIEKQIFSHCKIKPEDITDGKVEPLLEALRNFDIRTKID